MRRARRLQTPPPQALQLLLQAVLFALTLAQSPLTPQSCGGGGGGGVGRSASPAIVANDGAWLDDLLHDAELVNCEPDTRKLSQKPPQLLMMVTSDATPSGAERRSQVRRTWGSRRAVPLVFFLGRPAGRSDASAVQAGIDAEARRYRDLAQLRMPEGPGWATRRHLAALEWALTRCPKARHLVRVADSIFVDTTHLSAYLAASPPPGFLCSPRRNESPIRSRGSAWFVSMRDFPGARYPDLCDTSAYVVSNETALRLLVCAALRPPFAIDDVYVTGILREAAGVPLSGFQAGHGIGSLVPSDSRAWSSASDLMFLRCDRPGFIGVYWPGLWRSLLLRECSNMIF